MSRSPARPGLTCLGPRPAAPLPLPAPAANPTALARQAASSPLPYRRTAHAPRAVSTVPPSPRRPCRAALAPPRSLLPYRPCPALTPRLPRQSHPLTVRLAASLAPRLPRRSAPAEHTPPPPPLRPRRDPAGSCPLHGPPPRCSCRAAYASPSRAPAGRSCRVVPPTASAASLLLTASADLSSFGTRPPRALRALFRSRAPALRAQPPRMSRSPARPGLTCLGPRPAAPLPLPAPAANPTALARQAASSPLPYRRTAHAPRAVSTVPPSPRRPCRAALAPPRSLLPYRPCPALTPRLPRQSRPLTVRLVASPAPRLPRRSAPAERTPPPPLSHLAQAAPPWRPLVVPATTFGRLAAAAAPLLCPLSCHTLGPAPHTGHTATHCHTLGPAPHTGPPHCHTLGPAPQTGPHCHSGTHWAQCVGGAAPLYCAAPGRRISA